MQESVIVEPTIVGAILNFNPNLANQMMFADSECLGQPLDNKLVEESTVIKTCQE